MPTVLRISGRIVAVTSLALGLCVAVLLFGPAAAQALPPGCQDPNISSDGHTVTEKCASGRGSKFKLSAKFCDVESCEVKTSGAVSYGGTAKVISHAYFVHGTVSIYWVSGSSTCRYTVIGGSTSWCDINANIREWAARGNIVYDENHGDTVYNWYHDRKYRPDCSGLTDMAWHVSGSPNTGGLTSSSYTTVISHSSLRPGDLLDDTSDGHAVIFDHWDSSAHTTFTVWTFGDGVFADIAHHHPTGQSFGGSIAGWPGSNYVSRRYVKATG